MVTPCQVGTQRDAVEHAKTLPSDSVVVVVKRVIFNSGTVLKCEHVMSTIGRLFERAWDVLL